MRVFISWSGDQSHAIAQSLYSWLPRIIQSAQPWISSDVDRGVRWLDELNQSLNAHSIAVVCVTAENRDAPWLMFEAGAISRMLADSGRLIPYLYGFQSASDLAEPLGQFNACIADAPGTLQLIQTLNSSSEFPQSQDVLLDSFRVWWPKLEDMLREVDVGGQAEERVVHRRTTDKLDEVLDLLRSQARNPDPLMFDLSGVDSISVKLDSLLASVSKLADHEQERSLRDYIDLKMGQDRERAQQSDSHGERQSVNLKRAGLKVGEPIDVQHLCRKVLTEYGYPPDGVVDCVWRGTKLTLRLDEFFNEQTSVNVLRGLTFVLRKDHPNVQLRTIEVRG